MRLKSEEIITAFEKSRFVVPDYNNHGKEEILI